MLRTGGGPNLKVCHRSPRNEKKKKRCRCPFQTFPKEEEKVHTGGSWNPEGKEPNNEEGGKSILRADPKPVAEAEVRRMGGRKGGFLGPSFAAYATAVGASVALLSYVITSRFAEGLRR